MISISRHHINRIETESVHFLDYYFLSHGLYCKQALITHKTTLYLCNMNHKIHIFVGLLKFLGLGQIGGPTMCEVYNKESGNAGIEIF